MGEEVRRQVGEEKGEVVMSENPRGDLPGDGMKAEENSKMLILTGIVVEMIKSSSDAGVEVKSFLREAVVEVTK